MNSPYDATGLLMRSGQAGASQVTNPGKQWLATFASLAVGTSFFAMWFWLLPSWLEFRVEPMGVAPWRWIGAVPSVLGFAVAVRCIWDFGWTGRGTPAPIAPPRRLVVVGLYRYVRNPMYVGFFAGWTGLWMVFGRATLSAIAIACAAVSGVALFVQLYEEPTLRRLFGVEYDEYCKNVPRWLPRMHAWTK